MRSKAAQKVLINCSSKCTQKPLPPPPPIIRVLVHIFQIVEVGVLLGLMCKYSCEDSDLIVYGNNGYQSAELEKGTILDNMAHVLQVQPVSHPYNHILILSISSQINDN